MGFDFNNLNKAVATFNNAKKDLPFKKATEIDLEQTYTVRGLFIIDTKLGKRPFVVLDDFNVDLPNGELQNVETILKDVDAIQAINNGCCKIRFNLYYSKKYSKENCLGVKWCNDTTQF